MNINEKKPQKHGIFGEFSSGDNSYIKIDRDMLIGNDFRFCELSLWGVKLDALKTTTCKALTDNLLNVNDLTGNVGEILNPLAPGLLNMNRKPASKKSGDLLGLGLG